MASVIGRACSGSCSNNSIFRLLSSSKEIKLLGSVSRFPHNQKPLSCGVHATQQLQLCCTIAGSSITRVNHLQSTTACNSVVTSHCVVGWSSVGRSISSRSLVFSALGQRDYVRYNSTVASGSVNAAVATVETVSSANSTVSEVVASLDVTSVVDGTSSSLSLLAEPSLQSLGLASWTPSGLVQAGLESLHVGLDVPWWTAIVIGTICVRLAIFPLVILAQRNAAQMHNHMPTMQRLQERMSIARSSGDPTEAMKASNELMQYMHRNGVNPLKNLLVPLAQMPIFISVFVGVREMAALPVVSLKSGGILWFTDLTVPDPFYALPLMTMATLLATVEVGVDGVKAGQMGNTVKYMLRAMPFLVFPFIIKFPAAMLCYWFTSNAFSLIQVLFLRIPGMKEFFKIPKLIDHGTASRIRERNVPKKGFMESFRETMTNMRIAAEIEERKRLNALRMKESQRTAASLVPKQLQPQQHLHSASSQAKSTTDSKTK